MLQDKCNDANAYQIICEELKAKFVGYKNLSDSAILSTRDWKHKSLNFYFVEPQQITFFPLSTNKNPSSMGKFYGNTYVIFAFSQSLSSGRIQGDIAKLKSIR